VAQGNQAPVPFAQLSADLLFVGGVGGWENVTPPTDPPALPFLPLRPKTGTPSRRAPSEGLPRGRSLRGEVNRPGPPSGPRVPGFGTVITPTTRSWDGKGDEKSRTGRRFDHRGPDGPDPARPQPLPGVGGPGRSPVSGPVPYQT
jgi:hypothetical protein